MLLVGKLAFLSISRRRNYEGSNGSDGSLLPPLLPLIIPNSFILVISRYQHLLQTKTPPQEEAFQATQVSLSSTSTALSRTALRSGHRLALRRRRRLGRPSYGFTLPVVSFYNRQRGCRSFKMERVGSRGQDVGRVALTLLLHTFERSLTPLSSPPFSLPGKHHILSHIPILVSPRPLSRFVVVFFVF